jgi:hypothetical protein
VQGVLANKELVDEMLSKLCSGAKDCRHLVKAFVYTTEYEVQLHEDSVVLATVQGDPASV